MRHRGRQFDVTHAFATHLLRRDLDTALLADHAAILHALVLAAQALVVLDRAEDPGAEQAVPLRLEGPVVDGLRLLHLAERPGTDLVGAGERDPDVVETLGTLLLAEKLQGVLHDICPPISGLIA